MPFLCLQYIYSSIQLLQIKKNKGRIMTFRHLDFYIVYIVHCTFTLHCLPNNNNNNRDVTSGFDNYNN